MSLTCWTSQPVHSAERYCPHPLHLVVVGAADQVDELGVGAAQHGAPVDQPALVERPAEGQRARLRDDRLVQVEEGCRPGRARGSAGPDGVSRRRAIRVVSASAARAGGIPIALWSAAGTRCWRSGRSRRSSVCSGSIPPGPDHDGPRSPPGGGRRIAALSARPQAPSRRPVPSRSSGPDQRSVARHLGTGPVGGGCRLRPLIVTGDPALLDELLRLAAAAGVEPEVAPDVGVGRAGCGPTAPLVLVGDDCRGRWPRCGCRAGPACWSCRPTWRRGVWERAVPPAPSRCARCPGRCRWLVDRLGAAADGPLPAAPVAVRGRRAWRRGRVDAGGALARAAASRLGARCSSTPTPRAAGSTC